MEPHGLSRWRHGCSRITPVSPRRRPGGDTVAPGVFPVYHGIWQPSRLLPVVLNILKQPGTWAGLTRFNTVHPGSPRFSTVPPRLWHGSSRFIPDHQTGVNRHLKPGQWERGLKLDQGLCFFATLIENFPALIENNPKNLNLELKDLCLFLYLHGHKPANLEHELQKKHFLATRLIQLICSLTPVTDVSSVKHMKFICNLLNHVIKSWHICEELESNAKCSRFRGGGEGGGYFIDVKIAHVCYISLSAQISQNVKYWY